MARQVSHTLLVKITTVVAVALLLFAPACVSAQDLASGDKDPGAKAPRYKVVTAGDSITEGTKTPEGAAYPDFLARDCGRDCRVRNVGHGGQCLVSKGCYYPTPLVETFEAQVLSRNPDLVVVGAGLNDLCMNDTIAPLKAAYRELQAKAERAGADIVFNTISPYADSWPFKCEEQRVEVNRWMRDHLPIVDVDRALSTQAGKLRHRFDSGDGLHPSVVGNEKIAETVMRAAVSQRGRP